MGLEDGGGFNFDIAQTSKAAKKLPCTFYVYAYLIFVISYFCRINHRCNKDGILNTDFVWSGPVLFAYLLLFKRKTWGCNSKKEWAACAKPAKTLGTRLTNGKVDEVDESANQKVSEGAITAMATLDDNWQTKHPTISERTKFIFNNELLSDVKFAVPVA